MNGVKTWHHYLRLNNLPIVAAVVGVVVALGILGAFAKLGYMARAQEKGQLVTAKQAVLVTSMGSVVMEFRKDSPLAVDNFVRLARQGFYDGIRFHRSVPGLLVQTGDPISRDYEEVEHWGDGGAGRTFVDEFHADDVMTEGTVAMVNWGPNTNDSQFFIVVAKDVPWLVGRNTIFARVVSGMDVVKKINAIPVGVTGIPADEVRLERVVVLGN